MIDNVFNVGNIVIYHMFLYWIIVKTLIRLFLVHLYEEILK